MSFKIGIPTRFLNIVLLLVASFTIAAAESTNVDPTFDPTPAITSPMDGEFQPIIQADGKILIYSSTAGIFRLNPDGTTDTTFSYCNCGGVGIYNVMVGLDGKIILAGGAAPNHAKMIRLNSDGSIDNSFSIFIQAVGPPEFTGNVLFVNAIQSDGKVIATHTSWGNIGGTYYSHTMRRYNIDSTVDTTFSSPPLEGGHLVTTSAILKHLPDGRFYMAVSSGSHLGSSFTISRRLADGTPDTSFAAFNRSLGGSSPRLSVADLALADDGGLIATGRFWPSMMGGPYQQNLFRFLPNGAMYPGFAPPLTDYGSGVHGQTGGKILFSASPTTSASVRIMRLLGDGTVDGSFVVDPAITSIASAWRVDALDRIVFLAETTSGRRLVRLLQNGSLDPTFEARVLSPGQVNALARLSNGKTLVAGAFSFMDGVARAKIARVNSDGSLDTSFNPGTGFDAGEAPIQLVEQPDGKVLAAGGYFYSYNGTPLPSIVRLNTDGSRDSSFSVSFSNPGYAQAVALQPDGKILIGGTFSTVNGVSRTGIARLNPDGTLDTTFNAVLNIAFVQKILVEANGRITIGGSFSSVNGFPRNNIARLETNGALDQAFNPTTGPVLNFWQQPDGKYLLTSGAATSFQRINNNGSPDTSFSPPSFDAAGGASILTVLFRADGTMLVGGRFDTVGGLQRPNLTRLRWSGTHDSTYIPNGANARVNVLADNNDGKVLIGGAFNTVDNVGRWGIARLQAVAFQRSTPFDFDGDGRTDFAAFRPSTNVWYILRTSDWAVVQTTFGLAGDIVAPADFDGDGKTDVGIFRPGSGDWWYAASTQGGAHRTAHHGEPGDIPRPSDFDGDGKADMVVYRPSTGRWFRLSSTGSVSELPFGSAGDQPLVGDFDGDGKSDAAIFRPATGDWWYAASSAGNAHRAVHWGQAGDLPSPGDYDGDGKTDYAVFRPSEGGWYVGYNSGAGVITTTFGLNGDRPIPGDYDGDGRVDIAVFRPSTGIWYLLQTTSGFGGVQWGVSSDVIVPNAFVP
jgi:uncharacterized delta-60 repeat protein